MSHNAEAIRKHIRFYLVIGAALIVLTGVTVGVSYIHFGEHGNVIVALVIATFKAALVAAIFMHLFWDMFLKMRLLFKVLIFTVFFFAGLMALTLWSIHDEVSSAKKVQTQLNHTP